MAKQTIPDYNNCFNALHRSFEYKTSDNLTLEQVNELGRDGWELLFIERDTRIIVTNRSGNNDLVPVKKFWFKRELINK
jgi:hypothetical protein